MLKTKHSLFFQTHKCLVIHWYPLYGAGPLWQSPEGWTIGKLEHWTLEFKNRRGPLPDIIWCAETFGPERPPSEESREDHRHCAGLPPELPTGPRVFVARFAAYAKTCGALPWGVLHERGFLATTKDYERLTLNMQLSTGFAGSK